MDPPGSKRRQYSSSESWYGSRAYWPSVAPPCGMLGAATGAACRCLWPSGVEDREPIFGSLMKGGGVVIAMAVGSGFRDRD
jgi:hypothetical protein